MNTYMHKHTYINTHIYIHAHTDTYTYIHTYIRHVDIQTDIVRLQK